ncbi:MAG: hypothetical protein M3Y82_03110 [Verrucomicrobiota bacterium]|nr:hypothetical protein [Verrucomicrobiota bacterium]
MKIANVKHRSAFTDLFIRHRISPGRTGHWPVSSGDSPDETVEDHSSKDAFFSRPSVVPLGESPSGTGESPIPPILRCALVLNFTD